MLNKYFLDVVQCTLKTIWVILVKNKNNHSIYNGSDITDFTVEATILYSNIDNTTSSEKSTLKFCEK